ncbi:splicing factor 3B subunit 3 isoform X1 [Daktulosphaira vitifoliae]|uniref:splicing factor 3B subunit 3 isoform X1 n=1 Tax=Daktulosphaira vitifoliae TaxID=58002 RepID=UPI0021AA8592|nr:splicing factor 3B subunit 3 isoform X1 [Daktulosphaira vitifoliae]XP_050527514.1 splicing factor 3B subunit 3 isoform X1 [Daktulosphaira vitifoliae]
MYLYNITLQRGSGITHAIHGNFSGGKVQEILVSRGKSLELLRPDTNTGKVHTLLTVEVFGVIRSLMSFRQSGGTKDYIVVGSDSGRIVILEYLPSKNVLDKVHQETFGKSGCRRIVPGQYLAIDPKGRAIMIGAVEKQKLVYIPNRDSEARLTISSPLEANKSNTLVYHMVGIDVAFDNPIFACLEIDYEEADSDPTGEAVQSTRQTLTFYEVDFGLNHVVRKYSEPLEEHANSLISVPGDKDGPGGVLICSENYITYKNQGDQPDIRCPIPRRRNDLDDPDRGMILVCSATHKTKSMFFFLVQTEQGDIFKVTLESSEDFVTEIRLKYFDTVPVASAMCVLKTGFLFVASEFGNHYLYQIANLGDDDDEPEFSSAMPLEDGDTFFFAPRQMRNLVLVDEMDSLSPIMACQVADLAAEDTPQLYMACGRGPRSTLRVLRHGLEVSEMAVSELPGNPNAVWTVKRRADETYDAYIIVSFSNATLVLSIGETVEEVSDSGFLGTTPTLSCSPLGDDAVVQIYPNGVRHIRFDKRMHDWKVPEKKKIIKCAANQRQVVIALGGGELVYFEMDPTGHLNEHKDRKEMNSDVLCMALANAPSGEQMSRFLAVGLSDETVRIISLDTTDCLVQLKMQAIPAMPESLCIVEMGASDGGSSDEPGMNSLSMLYLNIGLQNGVLLRTVLDGVTGEMADTRARYLGGKPVKLFKIKMRGNEAVLAMSSRSWLSYYYQNRFHLTPLSYESLEYASGFASEQCPEGIVAISSNTLRILALEKLGAVFNQLSFPVEYTPRKFVIHQESAHMIVVETEHNAYTEQTKKQRRVQMASEMQEAAGEEEQELAKEMAEAFLNEDLPESIFGAPKAGPGMWASLVRLFNPVQGITEAVYRFPQNEAVMSVAIVKFSSYPDSQFVLFGVANELNLNPRHVTCGYVYTYKVNPTCTSLELVHKTTVDNVPTAICGFQGRVLIGVGRILRLYDIGKKKLLRKCENRQIPLLIVGIRVMGYRIYVSDVQESVYMVRYKRGENQLIIFADDTQPRYVTAMEILDYNTIATADKFGNISVIRIASSISDEVDDDPTGNKSLWDRGLLNGASQKADFIVNFHIGEICTSLQKATLIPGGSESLVYSTITGTIGVLVPFTAHEEQDFFQHLEMHMRSENPPLCGRDHLSYRSSYFPVKNVCDGDLCEQYNSIDITKQKSIAADLDKTPAEVSKRLEDMRTRYAF